MAATWEYNGTNFLRVTYTVDPAWPPGDNIWIHATDPDSAGACFQPVNPGDLIVCSSINDIGGLAIGGTFDGKIDDFDAGPLNYETQTFTYGTPFNWNPDQVNVWIDTYEYPNFNGPPAASVEVTNCALDGSVTLRLNRVSQASIRLPMDCATGAVGSFLRVYFGGILYFHGRILDIEASADENFGYVTYNASDPFELWAHRPVRDDDGDFTKPELIDTYVYAPQIIQAMFNNTEDTTTGGGGSPFAPGYGADSEGPMRQFINSVDGGVVALTAQLSDWPQTMAQFAAWLISTNTVDVVNTPIEMDVLGNIGQLDIYKGDYGMDLSSTVLLQYGVGARNVRAVRWNVDMTDMCNKLWYYLGPRRLSVADPKGDQHWQANITGTDGGLAYPPGGEAVSPWGLGPASFANIIGITDGFSRSKYDVRMDIKIFDGRNDEAYVARELFRRQWQEEQYLRAQPRLLIHVTPIRGDTLIGAFKPGDVIAVEITPDLLGGISGSQRVYEFTISWDVDSVPAISELQVSSDQSGFDT